MQMRQRYGQKSPRVVAGVQGRTAWVVPALALIHVIAFILAMSHNNCDRKGEENEDCVFSLVKRFPFQDLTENPLLGPSAVSLLDFGALQSELVGQAGQEWRLLTTLTLHAGLFHLAGNLACLVYFGLQLEREFGFLKVCTFVFLYPEVTKDILPARDHLLLATVHSCSELYYEHVNINLSCTVLPKACI